LLYTLGLTRTVWSLIFGLRSSQPVLHSELKSRLSVTRAGLTSSVFAFGSGFVSILWSSTICGSVEHWLVPVDLLTWRWLNQLEAVIVCVTCCMLAISSRVIWQILKVPRSLRQIEIMVAFAHDFTDQTFCTKLGGQV
jgi:hypothetical protein